MKWWGGFLILTNIVGINFANARWDNIPGSRYTSVRGAAMGDSELPLADDGASALFSNPAHLATLNGTHFEPLNLSLFANQIYLSNADLNFFKAYKLSSFSSTLQSNTGQQSGLGGHLFPNFYMRHFAVGILIQSQMYSFASSDGNINSVAKYQIIPTAGFGIPLARGIVRLGYSFQWVNETSGRQAAAASDPNLGYTNGVQQGSGFSHNAGFALVLPVKYNPSLNIVARNIGGTTYSSTTLYPWSSNSSGTPDTDPMSVDASFSLNPKMSRGGGAHIVLQLRDILGSSGFSIIRRATFGMQINFAKTLYFRFGLNGLYYPSVGIEFKRKKTSFGFAWYSEEIGTPDAPHRDIQFRLQLQLKAF